MSISKPQIFLGLGAAIAAALFYSTKADAAVNDVPAEDNREFRTTFMIEGGSSADSRMAILQRHFVHGRDNFMIRQSDNRKVTVYSDEPLTTGPIDKQISDVAVEAGAPFEISTNTSFKAFRA